MRSMPVVNNLHSEKRPKRHTSDIRPHTRKKQNKKRKAKTTTTTTTTKNNNKQTTTKKQTRWNIKLNHQPKTRQRRRSFILGDSNWNFFEVGYPVDKKTQHVKC